MFSFHQYSCVSHCSTVLNTVAVKQSDETTECFLNTSNDLYVRPLQFTTIPFTVLYSTPTLMWELCATFNFTSGYTFMRTSSICILQRFERSLCSNNKVQCVEVYILCNILILLFTTTEQALKY
eukprot:m.52679 g.52679  ORF g.52679 m.52679 type:complete len:124 (+) comp11007_c0_seq1:1118-1489(+)